MNGAPVEQPGAVIADRYLVEQVLGHGGMAIVYRVHDRQRDLQVALKRCFAEDKLKLSRYGLLLEREYHTLAQLAHPHIIEVYDYGMDGDVPYYTMELLDGIDLSQVDRMPLARACLIIHDIASALALLHSRGLLHRDVSTRNVAWAENLRAKLIDFGAMTTLGVAKDVVGTPSFMAPEVLQLQALDGRADIFSLGALAYRLLTGRHAFPARRFAELRDIWRSRPVSPKVLAPDVPAEVGALVMRMLTLDRGARVQTAGEVIEQFGPLAGIEQEDIAQISKAYLTTPTVVGRDNALLLARRHVLSLVRGEGGPLLVRGLSGSGRSRMLDVCVLEAKLVGAVVVRADGRDASTGEWGVARAIGTQLIAHFPSHAFDAARLSRHVLGYLFESLQPSEPITMSGDAPERSVLIRELRDWVISLARTQRLVVVVDDFERADEASAAWLTALAHKADRHPLMLALAVIDDRAQPLPAALQMLSDASNTIELTQLDPMHTDALIRSVFGDVSNVSMCASRVHALSDGNPRAAMELAQHLVDSGRATYQGGSWILPATLDDSDLPSDMTASLSDRLGQSSEAAREVAQALALTVDDSLEIAQYPALLGDDDHKQAFRAFDELVARRIVNSDGERAFFTQRGFIGLIQAGMPAPLRRTLHARIAGLLERGNADVFRRVHHLLCAGRDRDALDLLGRLDLSAQLPSADLLSTALERAEALNAPARLLHRLRMALLIAAPYAMDYKSFRRVAPVVLARLEHDSGLLRYRQLESLAEAERLTQAIAQTQASYAALPESERVYSPFEAIRELARVSGALASMALPTFDLELLQQLPALTPFYPLSPSLKIIADLGQGAKHWLEGRTNRANEIYRALLARIAEPDAGGFEPAQHERIRLGLHSLVGLFEAIYGIESAEEHAELLDSSRQLRVNAWRIRALLQLGIGDASEANRCLRRAELLQVQDGLKERYLNAMTGAELVLRARLGDLMGVKSQLPILAHLATQFPGWRPIELLGRSSYYELHGDPQTALTLTLEGLELARPGGHAFFSALGASQVRLLQCLQRTDEACSAARQHLLACAQHDVAAADLPLRAALVLADAGDCDDAALVLQPLMDEAEQLQRSGLGSGGIYEARARIAIAANDPEAFRTYADRCAREYKKSRNPALGLQLAALFDHARERGLVPSVVARDIGELLLPLSAETEIETLHSRFEECLDRSDRARCAITLLLQNALSNRGYLYGMDETGSVSLLCALPDVPNDSGISLWVERCARAWLSPADADELKTAETRTLSAETGDANAELHTETLMQEQTLTGFVPAGDVSLYEYTDLDGHNLEALLIQHGTGESKGLVALLIVENAPGQHAYVAPSLAEAIAGELLQHGDATVIPRAARALRN
jgi:predicted Ser/Thr protein kinase